MSEQEKPTIAQIRALYYRPGEAAAALGMTRDAFNHYVRIGLIKEHRILGKHRYFLKSDIQKITETFSAAVDVAEEVYPKSGHWKDNPTSTFELATPEDMPAIIEISRAIFGDPVIPAATRLAWMRKNPESFFVLRDQARVIVGYTSMFPVKPDVLDMFVRDEIEGIRADDILPFMQNYPLHLYVMAIGIDPKFPVGKKHEYGARMITGMHRFLIDLAARGVEVETITARSHKPDGIRLLRRMGIPQLRSPVPGKTLFEVRPSESGFPWFVNYTEILQQWQATHAPRRTAEPQAPIVPTTPVHTTTSPPAAQRVTHSRPTTGHHVLSTKPPLPAGWANWNNFVERHGLPPSSFDKRDYIEAGQEYLQGRAPVKNPMDPAGQLSLLQAGQARYPGRIRECDIEGCPCHEMLGN